VDGEPRLDLTEEKDLPPGLEKVETEVVIGGKDARGR